MGMPAFWLEDPQNNPIKQGSEQQVRYWVEAADGTQPCGAANYYIDNQAAGGAWEITTPQPQYWQGCPSGLAGGAGGLYLHASDTSQLSLGWHTLNIRFNARTAYSRRLASRRTIDVSERHNEVVMFVTAFSSEGEVPGISYFKLEVSRLGLLSLC